MSLKLHVTFQRDQHRFAFPLKKPLPVTEANVERLQKYHHVASKAASERIKTRSSELKRVLMNPGAVE